MTDAPAFFRAIETEPGDDTPRLVYADWLDENAACAADRARAEFIRVQCAGARSRSANELRSLAERAEHLLTVHGPAWAAPCPVQLHYLTYHRGFLEPVYLGPDFPRAAERLAELMPLHHLRLFKARVVMKSVAACPQLALVRQLTMVSNVLRNADVTALAVSAHLGNLRHLDLSENKIGIRGATDLATATGPALRVLRLANNPIGDRGLLALILADWPALEHLDLNRCGLTRSGILGLAESPLARRLRALQLSNNDHVAMPAWVALACAPLERLERLDLSNPNVTDEVLEALAANPALAHLRVLHLGATSITDRGARALLNEPHLRKLKRLRLPAHLLGATVLEELRATFGAGFNPPG
jgi:uncharacterized protein (TIGR02996 family)